MRRVAPKGLKKVGGVEQAHVRGDTARGHEAAAQVLWTVKGGVAGRVARNRGRHMARGQEVQENTGFGSTPVKKYELIMSRGHRGRRLEPFC